MTGAVVDVHGPNSLGFVIFDSSGRMMAILTNSGRAPLRMTPASAALYRGMTTYTGHCTIQENTIVTTADWHPNWENTEQRRFLGLSGDKLTLSTPVQEHPSSPGQMGRAVVTWVRERT
ncbi:lipocalin-like domain-containing protein [Bradyrhizobium sp. AUGA SZCCT0283]|uniref:lipocalin-like domain-containing protein n=1 Tax=Bradyrhizobium sp. AUGA SZCCT0283 TaxID=2807671 RepID=UPI001BAAD0A5|nr:lipocalin-like domain-containing protein [Bradyrhizobium sp. AUGA SZCCT0283]